MSAATRITSNGPLRLSTSRLNIEARTRTSLLPWRGQFSPQLVDYLLAEICADCESVIDPFCGSGTVLFEASRFGKPAFGSEVNPAAWHLSRLASLSALPSEAIADIRAELIQRTGLAGPLFGEAGRPFAPHRLLEAISDGSLPLLLRHAIAATILVGMGNGREFGESQLRQGVSAVLRVLDWVQLECRAPSEVFLADARQLPLEENSVGGLLTSPPYINVFNYHQNYRPAAELLGWKPLSAAVSEIGANRKHRQNRFLTVTQYCLDMCLTLSEASRILSTGAPLILVIGRTSNVLGAPFQNGQLILRLLESSGFTLTTMTERVFTGRYGTKIYEDILIGNKVSWMPADLEHARHVAGKALRRALALNTIPDSAALLRSAIDKVDITRPSASLQIEIPAHFRDSPSSARVVSQSLGEVSDNGSRAKPNTWKQAAGGA